MFKRLKSSVGGEMVATAVMARLVRCAPLHVLTWLYVWTCAT